MERKPDIEFTEEETVLLQKISFGSRDHDAIRASLEPMAMLTKSLLNRGAIPNVRLLYFTDPECNPGGRGKSRKDVFEKNGTAGNDILWHPNFMKYLEYFIFGPKLPPSTLQAFKDAASFGDHLSRSDIQDLLPAAKTLMRSRYMEPHEGAEEFHKLALECGALPSTAADLRQSIRAIRSSVGR